MLVALSIRDLAVIRRAELEFPPGLTAITGETGAGKTVLARALGLLAGAPADRGAVRAGARAAVVEGVLTPPEGFWDTLDLNDPALALRELVDDEREVVVSRRVPASGRSRALVDGHAVGRDAVAALVGALVRFSAQGDARRMTGPGAQLEALDAFAGPDAVVAGRRLSGLRRRLARADREVEALRAGREAVERERGELEALVEEVGAAALDPGERADLHAERERLRHADQLAGGVAAAREALASETGDAGAVVAIGQATRAVEPLAGLDPGLAPVVDELAGAQAALAEVGLTLGRYLADLDAQPGRLEAIEERLGVYARLERRYGGSTEAVLARLDAARVALATLGGSGESEERVVAERDELLRDAREVAGALRAKRAGAAPRLASAVAAELVDLAMPDAELDVRLSADDADPPKERCDIWLRANVGLPAAPLADAASGGELSRVLLALHAVGSGAGGPAWVFDEVDAGIGGTTATAVSARLARLATGSQALVITHLPQVAVIADANYRVEKGEEEGAAASAIERIEGDALVDEICRMLGAAAGDDVARRHAEELLARPRR